MTRHGPIRPRAEAIALRSTAPAVLDVGNTDLAPDSRAFSSRGNDHAELEIIKPTHWKPHTVAAPPMLSGDFTSKSP
jgi:hypothetical protein